MSLLFFVRSALLDHDAGHTHRGGTPLQPLRPVQPVQPRDAKGEEGEEGWEGGADLVEHVSSVVAGVDFRGCADGDYSHAREWVTSAQAHAEARLRLAAA